MAEFDPGNMSAARIYHLRIYRFRGIKDLSWHPASGVNIILGGGDVGKTSILEARRSTRGSRRRICRES